MKRWDRFRHQKPSGGQGSTKQQEDDKSLIRPDLPTISRPWRSSVKERDKLAATLRPDVPSQGGYHGSFLKFIFSPELMADFDDWMYRQTVIMCPVCELDGEADPLFSAEDVNRFLCGWPVLD